MPTRPESATMGPVEVPSHKYWGAQAQRSLGNFKIGWEKQPVPVVRALGIVKRGRLQPNRGALARHLARILPDHEINRGKLRHVRQRG